ncbi:DUF664 domain-containing protein [Micromonospora sp. L5]|uniref:mycothiol transferase n=1 Tax=Micromonospora sp. (strain L5) TaxID=648999 RepID=UPI00350F7850
MREAATGGGNVGPPRRVAGTRRSSVAWSTLRRPLGLPGSQASVLHAECPRGARGRLQPCPSRPGRVNRVRPGVENHLACGPRSWRGLPDETLASQATDLRRVVLHVIEETARHAGHLDAVRELIDGRTGLGPRCTEPDECGMQHGRPRRRPDGLAETALCCRDATPLDQPGAAARHAACHGGNRPRLGGH